MVLRVAGGVQQQRSWACYPCKFSTLLIEGSTATAAASIAQGPACIKRHSSRSCAVRFDTASKLCSA
eukprot:2924050-Lingulodinium_polyedra.AAC.1